MKIFISHKMPTDTKVVSEFGDLLALYGGHDIEISHAGKFARGENFKDQIEKEIISADMFIFFFSNPDSDWTYCMLECGLFRGTMLSATNKRLIVVHSSATKIPDSLSDFNAVAVDQTSMISLLKDIYQRDPWKIKADLSKELIDDLATKLVAKVGGTAVINFDLVPNFVIDVEYTEDAKIHLYRGAVPDGAIVSGSQSWQTLFDKVPDTGAWKWAELVKGWDNRSLYEFEIATMISDAAERNSPKGCYLRRSTDSVIYRLSLRRFEQVVNTSTNRFYFTAAPMDVESYWLPRESHDARETKLYHLVNISWFVRRRLVEVYYARILELLSHLQPDENSLLKLVKDVYHELIIIEIQSVIRGVDSPRAVIETLGATQNSVDKHRLDEGWIADKKTIFDCLVGNDRNFKQAAAALYNIATRNTVYYKTFSVAFAEEAKTVKNLDSPE